MSVQKLDGEVKCIVLASDGCWDMLDANEAVDLIHIFNKVNNLRTLLRCTNLRKLRK